MPSLKYIRGDMFSDKHWLEMFGILSMPSKSVEVLTFGDFLNVRERIASSTPALQVSTLFIYYLYSTISLTSILLYFPFHLSQK